jgi:hypothetical protein
LVRSGTDAEGVSLLPALRHGDPADAALHAATQGQGRSRCEVRAEHALARRTFDSLAAQNAHLAHWEATVADTRIHGTTKQQVGKVFAECERASLLPLAHEPFANFHEAERKVNRDGHVEIAKAYYSAPPEYLGRTVWVRWDARLVRLFNLRFEQIAIHVRREPGRFSTLGEHVVAKKINGLERGAAWLLRKVEAIGEQAHEWAQAMLHARGIEGTRVLQGLLALAVKHPAESLEMPVKRPFRTVSIGSACCGNC